MNIVCKNSLKNVFGKPLRTLIVVFAIFMCSFSALAAFDLGSMIGRLLMDFYGNVSRADIMVYSDGRDISELPEGFPEHDLLSVVCNSEMLYKDIEGEYSYVTTDGLTIYGLNIDDAVSMEFLPSMELEDGCVYITDEFAEDYGYSEGDTIILHDRASEEVELTVGGILPADAKNPLISGNTAIVNLETSNILSCGDTTPSLLMIDVLDDSEIEEAKDLLNNKYPGITISEMSLNDSIISLMNDFKVILYLLFAATVLLVIFVTSSICNRIVSERMSYIGTLRSLGMSVERTARILLLENVLYALFGSIPATLIYSGIRAIGAAALESSEIGAFGMKMPVLSKRLIGGVILGAVIIECLIPLRAILKALKTSIRDLIFDNRDTVYTFGKKSLITGLICLIPAVILAFISKDMGTAILCLVLSVGALALLFPRILRLVSKGVRRIADKKGNAKLSLAAVECTSRKSTVGSGVLCATASAMCIIVVSIAFSLFGATSDTPYSSDLVAKCNNSMKYYSYVEFLDGVTDVEPVYYKMVQYSLKDEENSNTGYIYAVPDGGYKYYSQLGDVPETLGDDSILIDSNYAAKYGISEGETISLIINPESIVPIRREYKVAGVSDDLAEDGVESVVISQDEFISIFLNRPAELLITCDDPDTTSEDMQTYGKGTYSEVKTKSEIIEENKKDSLLVNAVIVTIIAIAIGMTVIGVISNQIIGFEGRKKECAVMVSTAMSKKTLSGILFMEMLITSMTASFTGIVTGTLLLAVIGKALKTVELFVLDLQIDIGRSVLFFFVLLIAFAATVLFPIRNLKKMKISEQIKYE